jgi:cytoskeletal protein CcmA (bactofilin family)
MFSKPNSTTPTTPTAPTPPRVEPATAAPDLAARPAPPRPPVAKTASLIAADLTLEGNVSGGGELQIDGTIKGDVRAERVTIGEGGHVDGGVYAEAVEVRGRVTGSISAKQVRLYGDCHVDGDITHEQLAMETGAFFQGRSLRLQRPVSPAAAAPRSPEPPTANKDPLRPSTV